MKYFGKKSWASVLDVLAHIAWYLVLIGAIIGPFVATGFIVFSTSIGDKITSAITNSNLSSTMTPEEKNQFEAGRKEMAAALKKMESGMSEKDRAGWHEFKKTPLPVKILMVPYMEAVLILLLVIIKWCRVLFKNLKNEIVFNKSNVDTMTKIGKLMIAFSIMTFNCSSLFVCILLFMLREMLKSGTALQEEHDLTV